jgi:lipopolysaccharide export LptBFGC system permease protein LptF
MKWLFGIVIAIFSLILADRVLITYQQESDDFNKEWNEQRDDLTKAQKQFDTLPSLKNKHEEANTTVASASKASPKMQQPQAKKVYKDDFERRFNDFDKEFKQKWESF